MATNKSSTRHTAARKAAKKSSAASGNERSAKTKTSARRKYSPEASSYVEEEMKEMKQGTLKSGRSGITVHNPKQAIAIGLSVARKAGKKVPPAPKRKAS